MAGLALGRGAGGREPSLPCCFTHAEKAHRSLCCLLWGEARPVSFVPKGKAAASSGSLCISTERSCGLPSMFPGEMNGSTVAMSLQAKMATFLPLVSSQWHLSHAS